MTRPHQPLASVALLVALAPAAFGTAADLKVETFDVAPSGQWVACAISPHGVHTAALVKKDNRYAILLDGVEGPAFDELLPLDNRQIPTRMNADDFSEVAFSADGAHHAYLARIGDAAVVFRDGKEIARSRVSAKVTALGFSAGGNHLSYVESDPAAGTRVVVDGRPEAWLQETPKVVFSADGKRYAYVARK